MAANSHGKAGVNKKVKEQSSFLKENDPKGTFKNLQDVFVGNIQRINDPFLAVRKFQQELIPPMFEKYPNSPTAQRYLKAYHHFFGGWSILQNYQKDTIETDEDCNQLRSAFSAYAFGEMSMQHLFSQFPPPANTENLITAYMLRCRDDPVAKFFKVIFNFNRTDMLDTSDTSNYEVQKARIIEGEEFVHKVFSHTKLSDLDKRMLVHTYELLGAIYCITKQSRRALDSFQKCYDLDPASVEALYGIAYTHNGKQNEKAVDLFRKYIAVSPVCDKHYPNALYMLAFLHLTHYQNGQEALKYCNLAEEAEKQRLDFLSPVDTDAKHLVLGFKPALTRNKTKI